jgi:hypothetical protein
MKKINLKISAFSLFIAVIASSCVNSDVYDAPDLSNECTTLTPTKEVSDITALTTTEFAKYTDPDIIEAYVTSSDEGGNFYKSISMVSTDGAIGFSMPIDDYNLYTKFEPGRKVYVNMKDRFYVKEYNSTVIGSLYDNNTPADLTDDSVGRISIIDYKSVIKTSCTKVNEDDITNKISIQSAKNDSYLNKLIEFDNVQFTDESLGKKFFDTTLNNLGSATNHQIIDANGSTVILRVSQYAGFSLQSVPSGSGKIVGVMTKYNSDYQFMVRTINDIQLTKNRVLPFFEESFTSNFPNWEKRSLIGSQVWTLDTQYGNPGSCAKMSGYANSTNNANEDWLISPVLNMSSLASATLSFDTATKFSGNPLSILISRNYNGLGNPSSATWTTLTGTLSPSTGNYVWTGSGPIDISSFTGSGNSAVYLAFKYTSTTSASATWEVDNVKITAN